MSLIKFKNIIFDILFPPICLNCLKPLVEARNELICKQCLSLIKLNNTLFCPVCRARLAENKRICSHAITMQINKNETRKFYYLLGAAGDYNDSVLQNLIYHFKYQSFQNLAPILGQILLKYIENCGLKIEDFIVVPIPLHKKREKQRGFNQSKLISEIIAKNKNLTLIEALKRVRNTKFQSQIKNQENRQNNVFNCFQIKNPEFIKGKNIILIDDVFTSGSTMNEAVKILKLNGARQIIALVLAKA